MTIVNRQHFWCQAAAGVVAVCGVWYHKCVKCAACTGGLTVNVGLCFSNIIVVCYHWVFVPAALYRVRGSFVLRTGQLCTACGAALYRIWGSFIPRTGQLCTAYGAALYPLHGILSTAVISRAVSLPQPPPLPHIPRLKSPIPLSPFKYYAQLFSSVTNIIYVLLNYYLVMFHFPLKRNCAIS